MDQTPSGVTGRFRTRRQSGPALLLALLACAASLGVGGCAGGGAAGRGAQSPADPIDVILDAKRTTHERVDAVDEAWANAQAGKTDLTATRETLKRMIWKTEPSNVRLRALERLLSDTSPAGIADTRRLLSLRLPTETDWSMITAVSKAAADRGWADLTVPLVRSYSRPVPDPKDDARPERAALLALHPGRSIQDVVYEVFVNPVADEGTLGAGSGGGGAKGGGGAVDADRVRMEAWELLGRLDKDGSRRATLLATASDAAGDTPGAPVKHDPLLSGLRRCAHDLRTVPITASELQWMRSLEDATDPKSAAWWNAAAAAISGLSAEQARGLALRHAEPIRWAAAHRPQWLPADRSALRSELAARLKGRATHKRTAEGNGYGESVNETIDQWDSSLVWADLLAMLVIDEALKDPKVVSQLMGQVVIDRRDTTTEYGGVLSADDLASPGPSEGFTPASYPPRPVQRVGDKRFIASDQMIRESARSLAHYHFHVQKERNAEFAGPGIGDLEYAASQGRNCLVFTSVGAAVLDVDYYQRNGARVDLGEIR